MGNNYDISEYVVGVYQENGKPAHALIKADNHYTYIGPLKTICGHISNIQYDSPWAESMGISNINDVTCKRCLQILKQKSLLRIRKNKPIKIVGTCTYAMNYPVHALIEQSPAISNPVGNGPLLKALCGALAFSRVYKPDDVMSEITCKWCLKMIKQKNIIVPKKDEPIELMGIYSYNDNFPTHALIRREPKATDYEPGGIPPLRSVCEAHRDVHCSDTSPTGNKAILREVTCEMCLSKLKQLGLSLQPDKKKFFLIFYGGSEVDSVYDFEELLQNAHRFKPTINKILLVESYKEISVKEITAVVDEDGNEITEEDI